MRSGNGPKKGQTMIDPIKLLKKELKTCTQAELARRIGISRGYLNDVLRRHKKVYGRVLDYLGLEAETTYKRKRT